MNKIKKILALIVAMAMVLGTTMTVFAAGTKPTADDTATATVNNVEATATVTAYQIVKADYNNAGFIGYSAVDGVSIADPLNPTSDEITAIAKGDLSNLKSQIMTTTAKEGLASFTASLNPGYWMVLVTGEANEVYNPMLVGVYYSVSGSDNTMESEPVDANSNWTLETKDAYAKSTEPAINKTIVGGETSKGNDVAIGDTVNFQIATAIPSYSEQYTSVEVKISDTLSAGLTLNQDSVTVKVGENVVEAGADTYTITKSISGFTIEFVSDYALANNGKNVNVTYSATLNEKAGINFDANTNTAILTYTNNPDGTTKEVKDRTYTYTFGIDAKLNGESTEGWNKVTQEIIKGEMVKETVEGEEKEVFKPLAGAEFTLTNNTTKKVYTATSDAKGRLTFTGLDAGEYTLVETKAPDGYSLNSTEIPVVISAEYNADGTLKAYTITVNNKATSTYEATYEGETVVTKTVTVITDDSETTQIKNTKISELPSTGGIGTTIFTIGGCAIMIAAAAMFFISRRKSAK
ncbi:MAG: isopeptide-forming domain-containing fimbrial protein [Blautia sp.]